MILGRPDTQRDESEAPALSDGNDPIYSGVPLESLTRFADRISIPAHCFHADRRCEPAASGCSTNTLRGDEA